ncbi:MAG: 5-formyltetrahydrofolate cyclo-ligase [Clostridia bacterium]|nr:5-formyltetrahydrofolate cyclo-ligase [Clostridia bacterium]
MKNQIRKDFLEKRKALDKSFVYNSKKSVYNVISKSFIIKHNIFMSYITHDNELDLEMFNKNTKNVYIPVIDENDRIIPSRLGQLVLGKYDIYIPKTDNFINKNKIDIFLIPGIVYDFSGNRIGYGKAYYDTLLEGTHGIKIGCCYEWQITDKIVSESHDIKMDYLLTEKRLIKCSTTI